MGWASTWRMSHFLLDHFPQWGEKLSWISFPFYWIWWTSGIAFERLLGLPMLGNIRSTHGSVSICHLELFSSRIAQSRKTFQQWEKLIICSINAFLEAAEFNLVFVYDRFQYKAGSLTWRESFDWQQYQNRKSSSLTKQAVSYFGTICKRMVQSLFW